MIEDKEKSAIAEEATDSPTEDSQFEADRFIGDNEVEKKEESPTDEAVEEEDKEKVEEDTKDEDASFTWDEDTEKKEEETEEGEEKEEKEEENEEDDEEGEGWESLAEELQIEAESYEEFKDTLLQQKELASAGATNKTIESLKGFTKMEDEELMRTELKAQEYSDEDIDDEIDIMVENGTIRQNARRVRKDIEKAIKAESEKVLSGEETLDAKQQEEADEIRAELKEHMSKTGKIFGGKVSEKQKKEHFEYIDSGDFFDDISKDATSIADAAWLWKNKDRILKGYKTKGFEQGKASVIDSLSHPETSRSTRIPEPDTGDFNPGRFIDNETM
jgi:hypothetical protein